MQVISYITDGRESFVCSLLPDIVAGFVCWVALYTALQGQGNSPQFSLVCHLVKASIAVIPAIFPSCKHIDGLQMAVALWRLNNQAVESG